MTTAAGSSATTRPRRTKGLLVAAVVAALTLTGCVATADEPSGDAVSDSLLPPAEGTTEYPLTLRTWAGETVLEERPERVAVVGFSANLDAMQALGASPVYTLGEAVEWPWRDVEWMSRIEVVDTATRSDPLNFEGIAASTPDLIIAVNFIEEQGDFDKLAAISPVLEAEQLVDGDKFEWQDTQQLIGDALDLGAAAQEIIAEAERTIDGAAEAHPEFEGRTMTIAYDYTDYGMEYYSVAGGTVEGSSTASVSPRIRSGRSSPRTR
ncbi:MAG: ABC transporter substrate-binding protein [Propionibacteriaceae bacterium]